MWKKHRIMMHWWARMAKGKIWLVLILENEDNKSIRPSQSSLYLAALNHLKTDSNQWG